MQKSTTVEILKSFTEEDMVRFDEFISSSYHNKNTNIIRLFKLLRHYGPSFIDPGIIKVNLWNTLFPGREYNYGTMMNLIFELKKKLSKYLIIDELAKNKLEEEAILVRALGKRNVQKYFISKVNEIERSYKADNLAKINTEIKDYFDAMFRIIWMKHAYLRVANPKLSKDSDLHRYTSLMLSCFLTYAFDFHNNISAQVLDKNFASENNAVIELVDALSGEPIDRLLETIIKTSETSGKLVALHWLKTKALVNGSTETDFKIFREQVFANINRMSSLDIKKFLIGITNAANKLNSPDINVHRERLEAARILMKKNILAHDDGRIYALELLKYFWSAGHMNQFDVIEEMMNRYIVNSDDENRENVMNCGRIFINIKNREFGKALQLIGTVEPVSFMMKVHLRKLKARCYYELNDYDSFIYDRDSLNHFLKSSSSLSNNNIGELRDYFDKVNRMFRLRIEFDDAEIAVLKSEIMSDSNYPVWMKEHVVFLSN